MLREVSASWGVLFQDVMEFIPDDRKAEFTNRAYKLLLVSEYLAGKESERKVNDLCKQL
jgi:hypothetical protein